MSFEWVSVYECFSCGTSECATSVQYDRLGFPVCDRCRTRGPPSRN
ncbi:hypothetical protein [Salinigranum rubrum]|nr:hypothetical protein [Salinigranum rubrum]